MHHTSLKETLLSISQLPATELAPSVPAAERPNEMALLAEVLPPEQIATWETHGVRVTRTCMLRSDVYEMLFRIENGKTHSVQAIYHVQTDSVTVMVNHKTVDGIDSLEAFQEQLNFLAGLKVEK